MRLQPAADNAREAGVQLSVLPGGADAFAMIEPDVNDGLGGLEPIAVGDSAYLVCNGGEFNLCRIEAVSSDTWFSLRVGPPPADTSALSALGDSVVAMVHELRRPQPAVPTVGCDRLTDVDALSGVGLAEPAVVDYLKIDNRAGLLVAAERYGATAWCSWTSAGSNGSVSVRAIPIEESRLAADPTGDAPSTLPLEPVADVGASRRRG